MLDPYTAADLFHDGARVIGPLISSVTSLKDLKDVMTQDLSAEQTTALQSGIRIFFTEFTKEKQREIIDILVPVTDVKVGGNFVPLDSVFLPHFQGANGRMYKWLMFALQVQFADLSKGLGSVIGQLGHAPQSE